MEESHDISPSFSKPLNDATNIQIFFYFSIYNEFFFYIINFFTRIPHFVFQNLTRNFPLEIKTLLFMQNIILQELEDLDGILIAIRLLTAAYFFCFHDLPGVGKRRFSHPNCNGKGMICNIRERE